MKRAEPAEIKAIAPDGSGVTFATRPQTFVPNALPGEKVTLVPAGLNGPAVFHDDFSSPDRAEPVCRHFPECGGCSVQHLKPDVYRQWKWDNVRRVMEAERVANVLAPLVTLSGKRRRAVFSAQSRNGHILFGFHIARTHTIVDLHECPVLEDPIVEAIPGLKALVAPLVPPGRGETRITVTATVHGLDVALDKDVLPLRPPVRLHVAAHAQDIKLARLSLYGDPVVEFAPAQLMFGGVPVNIPPGAFVQAVAEAEDIMANLAVRAIGKAKSVADLFCGAGALTFPLAKHARVFAFDNNRRALDALDEAARHTSGLKPIKTQARDLLREPLSARELNEFDAVVFDPPYSGARDQAQNLAKSKVQTVVAVSCHPSSLAHDIYFMKQGGFEVVSITPIDQFLYSPHVEAVAVLRR